MWLRERGWLAGWRGRTQMALPSGQICTDNQQYTKFNILVNFFYTGTFYYEGSCTS